MSKYKECIIKAGEGKANKFDWGIWLISTANAINPDELSVGQTYILPGCQHSTHKHDDQDEILFILSGSAKATVGNITDMVGEGDMVFVPKGTDHALANIGWGTLTISPIKFKLKNGLYKECIIKAGEGKANKFDWGIWLISTANAINPDELSVGQTYILPGCQHSTHKHDDQDEILFILSGSAKATVGNITDMVGEGDMVFVPKGTDHALANIGWGRLVISPIKFKLSE